MNDLKIKIAKDKLIQALWEAKSISYTNCFGRPWHSINTVNILMAGKKYIRKWNMIEAKFDFIVCMPTVFIWFILFLFLEGKKPFRPVLIDQILKRDHANHVFSLYFRFLSFLMNNVKETLKHYFATQHRFWFIWIFERFSIF